MLEMRQAVQKLSDAFENNPADSSNVEAIDESRKAGSLQTLRSERTRNALLSAAEKIFARDGFEASRIEDIAAEAGRSRGAFYANFDNKTEVFLALRSRSVLKRAREFRELLMELSGEEARVAAIHTHILQEICNAQSILLQIEFKLFALRHPELLPELAQKHLDASTKVHESELSDLFEQTEMTGQDNRRKTLAVEALLEGFALNMLFSRELLTPEYLEQLIPKLLAEILPPSPTSSAK
jgi:AcrR family transcriptional regulator